MKTRSSKSRKMDIFPNGLTHGLGPKVAILPNSQKIEIFPKGLTHGFGPKMPIFQPFFLGNIGHENVFYYILERKNGFVRYNNKKSKNSKN